MGMSVRASPGGGSLPRAENRVSNTSKLVGFPVSPASTGSLVAEAAGASVPPASATARAIASAARLTTRPRSSEDLTLSVRVMTRPSGVSASATHTRSAAHAARSLVDNELAAGMLLVPSVEAGWGQQRLDPRPLLIGEVGWVAGRSCCTEAAVPPP